MRQLKCEEKSAELAARLETRRLLVALLWRAARVFRDLGAQEEQRACLGRLGALSGR